MSELKVENYPNLSKDEESGSVINTDDAAYAQYTNMKQLKKERRDKDKEELDKMKEDINEIKRLLKELVDYGKSI